MNGRTVSGRLPGRNAPIAVAVVAVATMAGVTAASTGAVRFAVPQGVDFDSAPPAVSHPGGAGPGQAVNPLGTGTGAGGGQVQAAEALGAASPTVGPNGLDGEWTGSAPTSGSVYSRNNLGTSLAGILPFRPISTSIPALTGGTLDSHPGVQSVPVPTSAGSALTPVTSSGSGQNTVATAPPTPAVSASIPTSGTPTTTGSTSRSTTTPTTTSRNHGSQNGGSQGKENGYGNGNGSGRGYGHGASSSSGGSGTGGGSPTVVAPDYPVVQTQGDGNSASSWQQSGPGRAQDQGSSSDATRTAHPGSDAAQAAGRW